MEIPEDYTHAQLWMKYTSAKRKLERVKNALKIADDNCPEGHYKAISYRNGLL